MKVCVVGPYTLPMSIGGFQSQVYHIYEGLKKLGVNVSWFSFEPNSFEDFDILQVMSTEPSLIWMMRRAQNKGAKIVLTPMQGSRIYSDNYLRLCLYLSRIPKLCTPNRMTYDTIRCADYLTPLCSFEANRLSKLYKIDKDIISIIPNGIDDVFLNDDVPAINLPFSDYLLIVGRIEHNKNQLALIEAANSLNKNLIIVGESGAAGNDYLKKCKAIAGKNVHFWGIEKSPQIMKALYKNAKLTVIPSFSEMVPLVAFESLSQKTPVICTNRCGIAGDEIPGLLFSDISKNDLSNSISQMWGFDRELVTNKGIYTWLDIARMYKAVYEKLLG